MTDAAITFACLFIPFISIILIVKYKDKLQFLFKYSCWTIIVKAFALSCVLLAIVGLVITGITEREPVVAVTAIAIGFPLLYWIVFVYQTDRNAKANKKMTGIQYEQYAADKLRHIGYRNVKFTPASGDHGADIIATSPKGVRCAIQCKYYSKPVGNRAVQEALAGAAYYGCQSAIVVTNNRFTPQAIEDAGRLGVILMPNF